MLRELARQSGHSHCCCTCMCLLAASIQAEVRDLQERLAIEKEAWEENYMKKQVCVKYIFVFILLLVHCLASVCIGDCVYVPVRAHVSVHVCVLKSHCSSPQEATLLAKERGLRENLRLERDKVSLT